MNCWNTAKMQELQRNDERGVSVNAEKSCVMWQSAAKPRIGEGSTTIGGNRVPRKPLGSAGGAVKHRDMVFSPLKSGAVYGIIASHGITTSEGRMKKARLIKERMKGKYIVNQSTGCWEWQLSKAGKGYGQLRIRSLGEYGPYAHRLSYIAYKGEIPKGMFVCHTCDNPGCVNPDHLFLGTSADNLRDMKKKDRHLKGERNARSVLTEQQVEMVHHLNSSGISVQNIARALNVAPAVIHRILDGRLWEHVFVNLHGQEALEQKGVELRQRQKAYRDRIPSDLEVHKMFDLQEQGFPQRKIGEQTGHSQATVSRYLSGERKPEIYHERRGGRASS